MIHHGTHLKVGKLDTQCLAKYGIHAITPYSASKLANYMKNRYSAKTVELVNEIKALFAAGEN